MDKSIFDVYLVNGNITIFCGAHPDEFKINILNSSLYAELVATQSSNDAEASWLTYTNILSNLEFTVHSRERQRIEFSNESLLNIIKQHTENVLTPDEIQIVIDVFSRIKKTDSDSLAIKTIIDKFNTNITADTAGTHALLTIVRKDKALLTLQISFKTTGVIDIGILDKPVLKSIDDKKNNIRILGSSLDERKYNEVRDTIIQKLGSKIETGLLHTLTSSKLN
ncbi:hypothetical protein PS914_02554 [Pseudomonas fluorescens]|uniref:hypothetical protein n=1 Tax=Pseudomonas fluorescens TaxID=294 RepID=UPI001242CFD9|nr:hypothetical protein [Pseudomonas fluorescens]VVP84795.1 hypothetical protein PS914_02554 [Pseudomonas fluorescens]